MEMDFFFPEVFGGLSLRPKEEKHGR